MTRDPLALFRDRFGAAPTHRVAAPGRVNLIGEHVDYVGLPVLPVALSRRVTILLRPREDAVVYVVNADPTFGERTFTLAPDAEPGPPGDWVNYLLAATGDRVRAALADPRAGGPLRGFDAVLASDVPVAAGLSSSAALVVATALALEAVNGLATPPLELAGALARAERFVGTEGGGMDQAISLCAREGHAAFIEFAPLRLGHVPVPAGWRFVVAHSLERAEKSGAARDAYNDRARACARALAVVRGALDEDEETGYPELLERHGRGALMEAARRALDGPLLRRFRHVVTEGHRVRRARAAMESRDAAAFGALMDRGHASLRDDYEVSSPELDRLVELAREGGAEGARLTGAGFGGCVVALCPAEAADRLMEHLEAGYYAARPGSGPRRDRLFAVEPGGGAAVTRA